MRREKLEVPGVQKTRAFQENVIKMRRFYLRHFIDFLFRCPIKDDIIKNKEPALDYLGNDTKLRNFVDKEIVA